MKRTEIEAQERIKGLKSELEFLENHRLNLNGLLIDATFRIELLKKLIKDEMLAVECGR
jgi:hypothetical protein